MESISRDELERMIFFEQAKEQAEQDYEKNSTDTSALTRWGGALLELAHFRQGHEAFDMIDQAVEKFLEALNIDGRKHETLWCLGNAFTSQGFLTTDTEAALEYFDKAADVFAKALKEEPNSEVYKKALEMTQKAPVLHAELQKQLHSSQGGLSSREAGSPTASSSKSDFWYDIAGWGILIGIGIAWVTVARTEQVGAASSIK